MIVAQFLRRDWRGRTWPSLLLAAALGLSSCGTPVETPAPVRLSLAADRSALPLANVLAAAYHASQPHIDVDVEPMGNALAASQSVADGPMDLALVTLAENQPTPDTLQRSPIAQDALAVVVHPTNPLDGLGLDQAAALFHGDIRDWSQLGGASGSIRIVVRETESGPRAILQELVLGDQALSPMAIVVPGDQELLDIVSQDPLAIGLVPAGWLDDRVKTLELDGAGPQTLRREPKGYPLALPVVLLSPIQPGRNALDFQRFVASREGQRVIAQHYALAGASP